MNKFIPIIVPRPQFSNLMNVLVPVIAVILTLLTGSIIFSIMGFNPFFALHTFFISPISTSYGISELLVNGIVNIIRIAAPIAKTPPNLSGIERKIA